MALDYEGLELSDDVKAALDAQASKQLEGMHTGEEFSSLLRNRDELLGEKKSAQAKTAEAEATANEAKLAAAQKNNDVESLNSSWQSKHDNLQAEYDGLVQKNKQASVNELAQGFANEHVVDDAFSRKAMRNEFAKRLDMRDGNPVVLDAAGNLTALSIDDLKTEFLSAGVYKAHILATKANGGGAAGGQTGNNGSAVDISKMNRTEKTLFAAQKPDEYSQWLANK